MVPDSTNSRFLFSRLRDITGGTLFGEFADTPISSLVLDSRKAVFSPDAVFFAIRGERHNGHGYILPLYRQGFRYFVVEELPDDMSSFQHAGFLKVRSSVVALQQIASARRKLFDIPIIGLTGSNGKTIIKEWLYQVLSRYEVVVKNPGSYNSQIGVPLSVWQIQPHHTMGIFEAGISTIGEMARLEQIIRPTLGIFTNIGSAHNEGFPDQETKVREKLKLFRGVQRLIYCSDHPILGHAIVEAGIPALSWGFNPGAQMLIAHAEDGYTVTWEGAEYRIRVPFNDAASVENCFHVVTTLLYLGIPVTDIQEGISGLKAIPMRMELKDGMNHCQIVDDSYNNDLAGLELSLQFLSSQVQKPGKTVILSDILESGLGEEELVRNIATLIEEAGVNRFIGIGPVLSDHTFPFKGQADFFRSTDLFLEHVNPDDFNNEVILLKGARVFEFERITRRLQRKIHGTVMEIDLGSLVGNFNFIKSKLEKTTRVMVMVKAFAYGSGSNEIASLLQYHRADYLGVAYPDEGVELRKSNITLPIMVMNASEESFDVLLAHHLEPEAYSFGFLRRLITFLGGRPCRVHIKLDTGMRRLGFETDKVDDLIRLLVDNRNIEVVSVFSHLAGADEPAHDPFSHQQARIFRDTAEQIADALGYRPLLHLLNSPGIMRLPEYQFDMVRLGIGLYGVDPTAGNTGALKPVATLKTIISQIKSISKGQTVGYGRRGLANRDMRIATIAIGYADGFSRAFSRGQGKVWVNGTLAPVMGNVCMDMTMIDITGISATEGDEVVIFGKELPIQEVAGWIETIPYEILTSTSERVKRVFVTEGL